MWKNSGRWGPCGAVKRCAGYQKLYESTWCPQNLIVEVGSIIFIIRFLITTVANVLQSLLKIHFTLLRSQISISPRLNPQAATPVMEHNFLGHTSPFSWDMQLSSMAHFPCFHFISDSLAQSKLYVIFILLDNEPFCIPAWPISRAAHFKLLRILRKAFETFPTVPKWVAHLASRCIDWSKLKRLEARPSDSYLIKRSLTQREIIYSGEGLSLLTVDHIYTFKRCLNALSVPRLPTAGHKRRVASCVHLLRRINKIYKGVKLSRAYLERAHDMQLQCSGLEEVHQAYFRDFHEPGVQGMHLEWDDEIPRLPELESPSIQRPADNILSELDTRSPAVELQAYERKVDAAPNEAWESGLWSPCSELAAGVTYPRVPTLTKQPGFSPAVSTPPSFGDLTTTICSRCLVDLEATEAAGRQELSMFLSPEWEDFRRIGLGILKS